MIEETIDLLLARLPRSSGDNLAGFVIDCDFALSELDEVFPVVEVNETQDPRSMVDVAVTVADSVPSIQRVHEALMSAWARLAYREYQAVGCTWYREAMVLRFVTASLGRLLVTGTIVARGGAYPKVVADFERDFSSLGGTLPSWER